MGLIAQRVVEPARHVTPDEVQWGHSPDALSVRLPERAEHDTPALSPSARLAVLFIATDDFAQAYSLEICATEATIIHVYCFACVRIHNTATEPAGLGYLISVLPEVTQLGAITTCDEQRWPVADGVLPSGARTRTTFPQSKFRKAGLKPLADDPSAPKSNLVYPAAIIF